MKFFCVLVVSLFSVGAHTLDGETLFRCGVNEFRLERTRAVISSSIALEHFSERAGLRLPIQNGEMAVSIVGEAQGSFEFKATVPGTPLLIIGQWGDGYEVLLTDAQENELAAVMFDSCEF